MVAITEEVSSAVCDDLSMASVSGGVMVENSEGSSVAFETLVRYVSTILRASRASASAQR